MDCLNGFKVNHAAVQFYHSKMSGSLVLGKQYDGHGCVGVFIKEKQTHTSQLQNSINKMKGFFSMSFLFLGGIG